jgi:hypothetical protein
VGVDPSGVSFADISGHGLLDVVVTDQTSGDVSVLLNDANHSFATVERFRAGFGPFGLTSSAANAGVASQDQLVSVVAGDFTGNGRNDLLVVNRATHSFTVLQNDSNGGFFDPSPDLTTSTGDPGAVNEEPGPVVVGDFNGDGKLDVAILMEDRAEVWIWTGDGKGHFTHTFSISAGEQPTGLTLLVDPVTGKDDLLVGNAVGDVLLLQGKGDGTFHPPVGDHVALDVETVSGQPQVLVANEKQNQVLVEARMPGSQQFAPTSTVASSSEPFAPSAAHWYALDRGNPTLDAVVLGSASNSVLIYRPAPPGKGYLVSSYPVGTDPVGLTFADVNGDGIPDLLVANQGSNDISVLIGAFDAQGKWSATAGPRLKSGGLGPIATVLKDISGDGIPDLLVTNGQSGTVAILPGRGKGFFDDRNPQVFSLDGAVVQPISLGPGGLGVAVTAAGALVGFNLNNLGAGASVLFAPAEQVLAAGVLPDGDVVAAEAGGLLALLAPVANGFEMTQSLIPLTGVPQEPSALAVLETASGLQVLVTSAGQDTIFVFAPQPQSPEIPGPAAPAQPVSVPSALAEAPLVLAVTLTAAALNEGNSGAVTALLPAVSLTAVAGVGGEGEEEGAGEPVSLIDGRGTETRPGLDEALRKLKLYRPSDGNRPPGPLSMLEDRLDAEDWAAALLAWWQDEAAIPQAMGLPAARGFADTVPTVSSIPGENHGSPSSKNAEDAATPPTVAEVHASTTAPATMRNIWRELLAAVVTAGWTWWHAGHRPALARQRSHRWKARSKRLD